MTLTGLKRPSRERPLSGHGGLSVTDDVGVSLSLENALSARWRHQLKRDVVRHGGSFHQSCLSKTFEIYLEGFLVRRTPIFPHVFH